MSVKPKLNVLLCAPRGFCAGVVRAIDAVEEALRIYGAPVYVRHEIVHNKYVVETLKGKGAIFVEELDEVPDTVQPVIFSAHGVPKSIPVEAGAQYLRHRRDLSAGDQGASRGRAALSSGPQGAARRPCGTPGGRRHARPIAERLDHSRADVEDIVRPEDDNNLAYVTQTTLSVDDTRSMVEALTRHFPASSGRIARTSATRRPTGRRR